MYSNWIRAITALAPSVRTLPIAIHKISPRVNGENTAEDSPSLRKVDQPRRSQIY